MQLFKDNLNDILVDKPIYLKELTLFILKTPTLMVI